MPEDNIQCPECEEVFSGHETLFEHLNSVHFPESKMEINEGVLKFEGVPPKYVVDGAMAGSLAEMHNAFYSLQTWSSTRLTKLDAFKSVVYIWAVEMNRVNNLLKDLNSRTLSPKHRMIQELAGEWFVQLTALSESTKDAKKDSDMSVISAAGQMVEILQYFHTILSEKTSKKKRQQIFELAKEDLGYFVGDA